jgi:hypothetical protein
MTLHTAKNTFKVRRIIAAMAAVTIPIIGIVGAQTAAAEPPKTQPAPPKASCTWNGQTTSDGGYHTETSGSSWTKYKCENGSWVKDSSCTGNCGPPPPKTDSSDPKGGAPAPAPGRNQLGPR